MHLHSFLAHLTRCTGRSRNAQHRHIGPRAGADNVLAPLLVAWRSHGDNSAMKSLTSGAKRSYLDLPVINALAIVFNATTQQMQLSAAPRQLPPPEIARGMQHIAARELHGGSSPDWGSGAARCLWQHLLVCTRRSGILIGRGARSGLARA
jgi:hypothetical protein